MAVDLAQTIVHKARTSFADSTTVVINGVTAANTLVLPIAYFQGNGRVIGVTSSPTNSWSEYRPANGDANSHIAIWHAENVASGNTTITLAWNVGGLSGEVEGDVLELTNVPTSGVRDVTVANPTSGTTNTNSPSVTSGTLALADEILIGMVSHTGNDTTIAHDTADSFTQISENEDNDNGQTYNSQYKIVAATTSVTANWSFGAARQSFTILVSFRGIAAVGRQVFPLARPQFYARKRVW